MLCNLTNELEMARPLYGKSKASYPQRTKSELEVRVYGTMA
jgi:hypothetical protein